MQYSEVIGQHHIKSHLQNALKQGRIPHAQLFTGMTGSGLLPMAIAYARSLLCLFHEIGSEAHSVCAAKIDKLVHPDLHFVYPVNKTPQVKQNISNSFAEEWRKFVLNNPYGSLYEWLQSLGIENKQGNINVKEAEDIAKKLALKSYEGGYKVMIIWMADRMNTECSNKILKILEEPPARTVIMLLTEDDGQLLTTIQSRCQKLHFPKLADDEIAETLLERYDLPRNQALTVSRQSQGDFNRALHLLRSNDEADIYETLFVSWVRTAFKAKGNKQAINGLLDWSDHVAGMGRESQQNFIHYCMELFRQAMLQNYKSGHLTYFESNDGSFSLEKFAPFIHQNNIYEIVDALQEAAYHIERNGNPKLIFTDLSIALTRLLHQKETA